MIDLDQLREALRRFHEPYPEIPEPSDDRVVDIIEAAARELLRLMETAETVWKHGEDCELGWVEGVVVGSDVCGMDTDCAITGGWFLLIPTEAP